MKNTDEFNSVRDVLLRYWEPIICNELLPVDEYDSYIPGIIALLGSDCTADQLSNYLLNIERNEMEVKPHPERTSLVASNLIFAWKAKHKKP